ncbi:hypothetical protein [Macrococcus brunensis]|uniref:hypothetical protein n=1 Tax=Macrococcus brunensis TaxID=198483 RepID=UPI001EF13CD9|nr:hypothetical protein [Macrococcus brunensis]ULG73162.1 hypothetical protein MGG12_11970 [Macrococcus brunensis]
MKKFNLFITFLSLVLLISTITPSFAHATTLTDKEKQEQQLANELKKMFEGVNLKENPDGSVTGDIEKLKSNLPEKLRNDLIAFEKQKKAEAKTGISTRGACPTIETCKNVGPVSQCVNRNLKNIVPNLTQDTFNTIWGAIVAGNFATAARGLTKAGLKLGAVTWASGQIAYYVSRCIVNHDFGK